jgi:hypothetical protein
MVGTSGKNTQTAKGGPHKLSAPGSWGTERWVAVITILALLLLIGIRMGFRSVNVLGVRAGV